MNLPPGSHGLSRPAIPVRVGKLFRLTWPERSLVLRVWLYLWIVRIGLWLVPVPILRNLLGKWSASRAHRRTRGWSDDRLAWALEGASPHVLAATCLVRAIALETLLLVEGRPSELVFGFARNASGRLEGHAWLDLDGRTVVGGGEAKTSFQTGVRVA